MESQYKALLQNIVNAQSLTDPATGTPFLPGAEFFRIVEEQFGSLLGELDDEKAANNGILSTAHDAIKKCNSEMESAVGAIADHQLAATRSNRGTHSDCRQAEDLLITSMETECGKFDSISGKCNEDQDWYAAYSENPTGGTELQNLIDQAEECKVAVTAAEAKADTCDDNQHTFKKAYCDYGKALNQECKDHGDCYARELTSYQGTKKSVEALEIEQKTIYKMVKKVQCYINKLKDAKVGSMPEQKDINDCVGENPTTTPLDITYPEVESQAECQLNSQLNLGGNPLDGANTGYMPGNTGGSWYTAEFVTTGLSAHQKLNSDCGCGQRC